MRGNELLQRGFMLKLAPYGTALVRVTEGR
jgi:hypothetical protein